MHSIGTVGPPASESMGLINKVKLCADCMERFSLDDAKVITVVEVGAQH